MPVPLKVDGGTSRLHTKSHARRVTVDMQMHGMHANVSVVTARSDACSLAHSLSDKQPHRLVQLSQSDVSNRLYGVYYTLQAVLYALPGAKRLHVPGLEN